MSAIATEHSIDPRPNGPAPAPTLGTACSRSLSEAVAAVNEHTRRTEMRRVRQAHASMNTRVTLPRAAFAAMQTRLRDTGALQRLLDDDAMVLLAFDTKAPHRVREVRGDGVPDPTLRGQPLQQWVGATGLPPLRRALLAPNSELTTTVELHREGGPAQRHLLHLLPTDPMLPGSRWSCLVRLPDDASIAERLPRRAPALPGAQPRPAAL